ncbi:MAG: dipeptide ABC transporter ATP-binding protein [Geminicoccaceae bacterium]|nr:MAG: dipeptide ABC transporter ATP-binding protein [Geminicoccaceae bacterium]
MSATPLLQVEGLKKHFPVHKGVLGRVAAQIKAVDGVSFEVAPGEILCVVGESGCGKSTVGRLITRLLEPTAGRIVLDGTDVTKLDHAAMRPHRRQVQMVFQDPYASLNPRLTVGGIIAEPLENFGLARGAKKRERVAELLQQVGLRPEVANRFPHEFSGGQRQRLGIARALALNPKLIVADEPVSALDVSVQAQVLNLMSDLQRDLGLAYVFVSHDLGVVEHIGHRIAVMYLGRIVELAEKRALFDRPLHPYSRALLAAAPIPDPKAKRDKLVIEGDVPSPKNPPPGCHFHTRCPFAVDRCRREEPPLRPLGNGRKVACHLVDDAGEFHGGTPKPALVEQAAS